MGASLTGLLGCGLRIDGVKREAVGQDPDAFAQRGGHLAVEAGQEGRGDDVGNLGELVTKLSRQLKCD
ncbi:hypothetical protein [Streptomyces sp. NPDC058773]|uniref:hypothetical protein n=1 Tax=Streptomyces sp. NPDC058773 TaxID=3346632 RepID=UPI0036A7DBD1